MALSERDVAILALEAAWPRHSGMKEQVIRQRLGTSAARYYQLLDRLIDTEAALAFDPVLVGRLRRRRDRAEYERKRRLPGFRL